MLFLRGNVNIPTNLKANIAAKEKARKEHSTVCEQIRKDCETGKASVTVSVIEPHLTRANTKLYLPSRRFLGTKTHPQPSIKQSYLASITRRWTKRLILRWMKR